MFYFVKSHNFSCLLLIKHSVYGMIDLKGCFAFHNFMKSASVHRQKGGTVYFSKRRTVIAAVIFLILAFCMISYQSVFFIPLGLAFFVYLWLENRKCIYEKEMEIKYREQLFGMLANHVDDIFIMFSPEDYTVEYVSPNISRVLGVSVARVKKDLWYLNSTALETASNLSAENLKQIGLDKTWTGERERIHQITGQRHWYQEALYRVSINHTDRFILVLSDRTKERKINQNLQQALDIAKDANAAKSSFLSMMSHDIRTPMNAIVGFSLLICRDAESPEKVREHSRKIAVSGQHMLCLINDILDMSKIENGKIALNVTEFCLADMLEELKAVVTSQAKVKNQEFDIRTFDLCREIFYGDRLRLTQILMNLLSNAIKYTPENGKVELLIYHLKQTSRNYEHLRFTVKDNGIGMSENFLKVIFDPFTRESGNQEQKQQGTGLGMTITKNLVDLMGGSLSVDSKPGEGSIFSVDLELRYSSQNSDEVFWKDCGISKILVVDNDPDIWGNMRKLMTKTGVEILYAPDGYAAVGMACKALSDCRPFNLILLAWKMLGIDGVETARRLRAVISCDVPILVMTLYDWSEIEEDAKEAGISAFLPKPFFVAGLKQIMEEIRKTDKNKEPDLFDRKTDSLSGMMFLIAEDTELNAEVLSELLKSEGSKCETVVNGREAVEKLKFSKPGYYDMILMDIQMPILNGYDAAREIRTCSHPDAKEIPIVAMTANAFAEDVQNAYDAGMNAHVAKPVELSVLRATIVKLKAL